MSAYPAASNGPSKIPGVVLSASTKSVPGGERRMPSSLGDGEGAARATAGCNSMTAPTPMTQSRRPNGPMLMIRTETSTDSLAIPTHVTRQPPPQLKPALPGGPVAPGGRHLGHPHAEQVRLHRQLDTELEPPLRLDGHLVEKALRVHAEVAGGVVNRDARHPVQRQTRRPRHGALEKRPPSWRPPRMYRDPATTAAPARASSTIGSM